MLNRLMRIVAMGAALAMAACGTAPVTPVSEPVKKTIQSVAAEVKGTKVVDMSKLGARGSAEGASGAVRDVTGSAHQVLDRPASAALVPLAMVVGSAVGALSARSPEEVDAARAALRGAVERTDFSQLLRASIAASGRDNGSMPVSDAAVTAGGAGSSSPGTASHGLSVEYQVSYLAYGSVVPIMQVYVHARAVLRSPDGQTVLHTNSWGYCGRRRDFIEMARNNGSMMADELSKAAAVLGTAIVYDTFISRSTRDVQRPPSPCMDLSDVPDGPLRRPPDPGLIGPNPMNRPASLGGT